MCLPECRVRDILNGPLFDSHVHSQFSVDGHDSVASLCQAALEGGLAGLCLAEHYDTEPSDEGYGRYDFHAIARAAAEAGRACGGFLVLVGAEVCYQPQFAPRIAGFLRECAPDFVLGSVHYVRGEFVMPGYFARHPAEEAYDRYFEAVEELAASGLCDALGHLDLAKRHGTGVCGPLDPRPYWPRIERILRLLVERGVALEINTSGWRQAPGEPYPGEAIVRRYAELGGTRITIGSDAHRAEFVGRDIARAHELARRAGLTHATRYVGRRPELYPL